MHRQIALAKSVLEAHGYTVMKESNESIVDDIPAEFQTIKSPYGDYYEADLGDEILQMKPHKDGTYDLYTYGSGSHPTYREIGLSREEAIEYSKQIIARR